MQQFFCARTAVLALALTSFTYLVPSLSEPIFRDSTQKFVTYTSSNIFKQLVGIGTCDITCGDNSIISNALVTQGWWGAKKLFIPIGDNVYEYFGSPINSPSRQLAMLPLRKMGEHPVYTALIFASGGFVAYQRIIAYKTQKKLLKNVDQLGSEIQNKVDLLFKNLDTQTLKKYDELMNEVENVNGACCQLKIGAIEGITELHSSIKNKLKARCQDLNREIEKNREIAQSVCSQEQALFDDQKNFLKKSYARVVSLGSQLDGIACRLTAIENAAVYGVSVDVNDLTNQMKEQRKVSVAQQSDQMKEIAVGMAALVESIKKTSDRGQVLQKSVEVIASDFDVVKNDQRIMRQQLEGILHIVQNSRNDGSSGDDQLRGD